MKRYRVFAFDFDSRPSILSTVIEESWESDVKELWRKNKVQIRDQFLAEYGSGNGDMKIDNFIALGPAPFSILSFHNKFLRQLRDAFVVGAYYPARFGPR